MWLEYLRMAKRALLAHRFRSSLTVTSITIGAFAIVLMTSLAQSGLSSLMGSMEELGGARVIMIGSHRPERAERKRESYTQGITAEDREYLLSKLPHIVQSTLFSALDRKDVVGDSGVVARTDFVAASADYLEAFNLHIGKGRMFTDEEAQRHARVCVVGYKVAKHLWDGDAVGRSLNIAGLRCKVVGQLANEDHWGVDFDFDWLDHVVLPRETVADVELPAMVAETTLVLKTDDLHNNDIVKRIINAVLMDRHHGVDDFMIWDFNRLLDKFRTMFAIMEAMVGFIAGIALLVGGIGVMNMMLVSVSERVREIGIRKAIGASPYDIGAQFICEAVLLSTVGGAIGVGSGIGMAFGASALIHHFNDSWISVISIPAVTLALIVSISVGVIFGFFPARRAGRLDAILAIRS